MKKMLIVVKEVLERVIEVEYDDNSMEKHEAIDQIQMQLDEDNISLTLEDFKGESSVEECTNCTDTQASQRIVFIGNYIYTPDVNK